MGISFDLGYDLDLGFSRSNTAAADGMLHDDVMTWKPFLHNWPFVRVIHWSPVDSPTKGQ